MSELGKISKHMIDSEFIQEIEKHFAENISSESGIHNQIRYYDNTLQVKIDNAWIEIKGGSDIVVSPVSNFTGTSSIDGLSINLTWNKPTNAEFTKVELYRSTTDITNLSIEDTRAVSTKVVNDGVNTSYVEASQHGQQYYFKIYAVHSIFGVETYSDAQSLNIVAVDTKPPSSITNFTSTSGNGTITLNWTKPSDIDLNKVIIRYQTGSYPTSHTSGQSAYDGSGTSATINGLINGTTYYFRAFTVDTRGNINVSTTNQRLTASPAIPIVNFKYGVRIDKNNSNPDTRVTYIGDSLGFTPMRGNNGSFSWGSWESHFENLGIKPVMLKNKVVQYYLDPNDYSKKADGSNADITTGNDGDVMIEFGKMLWWKWTDEGTTYTIEISNTEFAGAVKYAFEIEEGYNQLSYYPLLLLQQLFIILFKSTNSQEALGYGGGAVNVTGSTNNKGFFCGSSNDQNNMKFLGIESLWGQKNQWIDGALTNSQGNLLLGKSSFNNNGTNYQSFNLNLTSDIEGMIKDVQGGNDLGYIIKDGTGGSFTYYSDLGTIGASRGVFFGGSSGQSSGIFNLNFMWSISSTAGASRLSCFTNGKLYIGSYLGSTVSGKLRSISEQQIAENKSVGTFRTEAKANN